MSELLPLLPIHSLAEARAWLRLYHCPSCGAESMIARPDQVDYDPFQHLLEVQAECASCGGGCPLNFDTGGCFIPEPACEAWEGTGPHEPINPTPEPSGVIDVTGWLNLYTLNRMEADNLDDAGRMRPLNLQAGEYLDEALKFYDVDNDLPPDDAFFSQAARDHFRVHPELYTRQRLLELRHRLPSPR